MPPPAASDAHEAGRDPDSRRRRVVWAAAAVVLAVAGVLHADKAGDDRSAFVRWRPQVLAFGDGVNIYETMTFPNPPILPITLYPLAKLPPVAGAMAWFAIKAALAAGSVALCFAMVRDGGRPLPSHVQAAVLLLTARPILGDLQHGNNNLLILFLICAALSAWRKHLDVLAGLTLGLAIAYKVTPALFVPYFLYRRSWRTVAATFAGLVLFLVVVPSAVIGPAFNAECLGSWWSRMINPYVAHGVATRDGVNQSLVGVFTRLATESSADPDGAEVNLVSIPQGAAAVAVKALSVGLIGLLAAFCRTKTDRRDDPRLMGEFALVALTMLFVSERSWKHHYVTLLIPATYLAYRLSQTRLSRRARVGIGASLGVAALFMAATSSELGGLFAGSQGHKIAQGYGLFLWAAAVLYVATAWRVVAESRSVVVGVPPSGV